MSASKDLVLGFELANTSASDAKLSPIELKMSETLRLRRLSKGAKYKEDLGQLVVPLPRRNPDGTKADPGAYLVQFLRDLVEEAT